MSHLLNLLALVAVIGMVSAYYVVVPSQTDEVRAYRRLPHDELRRVKRQFGDFMPSSLGQMAGMMGGGFPGMVQSSQDRWGSFKQERNGGFSNSDKAFIIG
ncbi:unnamed protein product, partial [Mesorhabditis spiculigera]